MGAFRFDPALPAADYKTYSIRSPLATHTRPASCEEVGCPAFQGGWITSLDTVAQADLIGALRAQSRPYTEFSVGPGRVSFEFAAGTPCFRSSEHRVSLERPEFYVVRDGDWRGNPRGTPARLHARPDDWVEDFADHQDAIKTITDRG